MKADKKDTAELIDMKYFKKGSKILEDAIDTVRTKVKGLEKEADWGCVDSKAISLLQFNCSLK